MHPKHLALILIFTSAILISGCIGPEEDNGTPTADDSGATAEGVNAVISANNQFAFDLYSKYKDDPKYKESNIFFSPYSISTALAMTYEGAKGQTAEEMQSVFNFPEDSVIRRSAFANIYNEINKEEQKYRLSTANALWAQENYPFLDEYFNTTEKYYGGKVTNMDFRNAPEPSRLTINKWVEDQTNDKIKDLIPQGQLDPSTKLVLTNAIYFKGDWALKFDKVKTTESDFRVSPSNTVKAQMMSLTGEDAKFNYAQADGLQILELPYEGDELSMIVLLPEDDDISSLENELDSEKLDEWKSMLREREINVYMPKFKFETKYFMKKDLSEMGMPTAFTSSADFSGMTGKKDLYIDQVIHQAFVEVDEEGTEAAAATAVVMKEISAAMPSVFRADHPFIFIIQQKDTGNILFMGKVTNPAE
ncbi:MAG: serpin family protein [Candidatus Aenigmarchaeota archaeon]|nr:serpin family protein [Candidatus Aenigmarchaeota archaeon]